MALFLTLKVFVTSPKFKSKLMNKLSYSTDGFYYHFWRIDNNSNVGSIYHFYLKILRDSGNIFDHHLRLE